MVIKWGFRVFWQRFCSEVLPARSVKMP